MADWKQKGIRQGKESVEKGRYSIFCIADWFLSKEPMPYDKVQGLCYYAQAWCYTLKGYKLTDTDFLAWPCGTVAPALYERFWYLGYEDITVPEKGNLDVEPEDISLLEDIWVTYGDRTGNALATLTCREFPWIEARVRYTEEEPFAVVISPESMKTYYKSIYIGA